MTDDDAEVQAGREWAAQDLRHRVKAAEEKHGRDKIAVESARKEERLKAEKQRLNTEKKARWIYYSIIYELAIQETEQMDGKLKFTSNL